MERFENGSIMHLGAFFEQDQVYNGQWRLHSRFSTPSPSHSLLLPLSLQLKCCPWKGGGVLHKVLIGPRLANAVVYFP